MNVIKKISILSIALFTLVTIQALEPWKKPEIPKDEAGRYKLEADRAKLHNEIVKAEEDKKDGKEVDETELTLKKKQQDYIDTTLSIFDEEHSKTPDQATIDSDKEKLGNLDIEIAHLEQQIQTGFNPSDGTKKPNFIEQTYLKIKRFVQERQLKKALASQNDVVHINRLQSSLSDVYTKLNDAKAKEQLEKLPINYRPEAVVEHLQRFSKAFNDPRNVALTQEIQQYLQKYLKKIIQSGLEFELENKNDQAALAAYHTEIARILESMGIDEALQKQALQSITDSLQKITPEAINTTIANFFDNRGDSNSNTYNQLKKEALQELKDYSPLLSKKFQNLEAQLQDLYLGSSFAEQLTNQKYRTQLYRFLNTEYTDVAKAYEQYSKTHVIDFSGPNNLYERQVRAKSKAQTAHSRLEQEIREQTQKIENTLAVKAELSKNKDAKPLSDNAKKLSKDLEQNVHQFTLSLEFGPDNAQNGFKRVIDTLNSYINETESNDSSRDGIDTDQKSIDAVQTLIDDLYEHAEFNPLGDQQKNLIADWITQLINKTFILNQERAKEFKDLLRELPNGKLIELPQSVKNPNNEPKAPENKKLFDDIENHIVENQSRDYKALFDNVLQELIARRRRIENVTIGGF